MDDRPEPDDARVPPGAPSPADRLRARAAATDRAARFAHRLEEVEEARERRRRVRLVVRLGWVALLALLGALVPVVLAAVTGAEPPAEAALLVGAATGAVVGAAGPTLRELLARRRGAAAWDAYHERHVLFGDPSARVRDADRPTPSRGGPPSPPDRR